LRGRKSTQRGSTKCSPGSGPLREKGNPMKNTRNSTQVTKVSHHHQRSKVPKYVDLTAQGVLLVCAVADISGALPLSMQVLAFTAFTYGRLRG